MRIEIDQSGKIEDTRKLTVVACANGQIRSIMISAKEKRKLIITMRALEHPRMIFVYKIFAGLIFLLIHKLKVNPVLVDREYPGHEGVIKDVLRGLFARAKQSFPSVAFFEVKKKSPAHKAALAIFRGDQKPDMIVTADDILSLFYR